MKKLLLSFVIACICLRFSFSNEFQSESKYNNPDAPGWSTEAGIGLDVPLKWVAHDKRRTYGTGAELNLLFRGEKASGLAGILESSLGPYFNKQLELGESKGAFFNLNFVAGPGYNFLRKTDFHSFVICAVAGFDIVSYEDTYKENHITSKVENTLWNFEAGIDIFYCYEINTKLSFYTSCTALAGIGFASSKITKTKSEYGSTTEDSSDSFSGTNLFAIQPKIGVTIKL